jgi:hypothetical protein
LEGAVLEDVAEVGIAASAKDLGPYHAVAVVVVGDDVLVGHRPEETGPASPGVELGVG